MKRLTILVLQCFICLAVSAQDLRGIWQGYITGKGLLNRSEYTLHVKSQDKNIVTGKAYLYSNKHFIFHGIFEFIGKVYGDKSMKITELRILDEALPADKFMLCIKYGNVKYSKDTLEHLTGSWGNTHGNCPPGGVYLEKVPSTIPNGSKIPEEVMARIREDKNSEIPFLGTVLSKPIIIDVKRVSLRLSLKDYLKEDFDTVSVYFNRQEIIKDHRISNKPYTRKLNLDVLSGLNEVVIYAKNLGRIPPNTCTLIVDDGYTKQKVSIMSDKQNSAAIYLNYTLPEGVLYRSVDNIADLQKYPDAVNRTVIK